MHYHCNHCCSLSTDQYKCPACGHDKLKPIQIEVHNNPKEKE